jgi:hypothetical protein
MWPDNGKTQASSNPVVNEPDTFAWELFVKLNHPADLAAERGTPDATKRLGDPGLTVWETWKLARTEVFLGNGCKPPDWNAPPPAPEAVAVAPDLLRNIGEPKALKFFDPPKFAEDIANARGMEVDTSPLAQPKLDLARALSPAIPPATIDIKDLGNETRMNKPTFEFVVKNHLYNMEGQEDLFRRNIALDFPKESIEIKAAWRQFSERELDPTRTFEDLNNDGTITDDERGLELLKRQFHIAYGLVEVNGKADTKPFGLVGLHIISKDIPNWFWATFEHVSNPVPAMESIDRYSPVDKRFPPEVAGTVWQNYRLRGTQIDFVTATGRPTLLGNTQIEGGFQASSSCISCHARATIGQRLDDLFAKDGQPLFRPGTFIPPSGAISRPPSADASYPFGANRLTVFKDLQVIRRVPTLPANDPQNAISKSAITGSIGAPDPELFVLEGTSRQQYAQLDFVWSLRRAFRRDPAACPND